jgi:transposase
VTCIQKEVEVRYDKDHHLPPIIRIPDKLWDEIKKVLPKQKPSKTVGRPIVPYRKVLDGILYVLRTEDASGRCFPKNTVQVQHAIGDFRNGIDLIFLKRHGSNY